MVIFGIDIRVYFLLFMLYSFIGWCMEVTGKLIQYKRFINRGFLVGPYCPIYGTGAILITFLLNRYTNDPFVLFIMAILVCGTLEYLTSYFMEKIYHARWWDYSQRKFNINGRVCLNTIIPFGLLGLFIMYVSNPFLIKHIESLPEVWLNGLFWTILVIYLIDNIISGKVITSLSSTTKKVGKELDNTEEITKKVKEILMNKSILHRRFLNAYPRIQAVKVKIKEKREKIKEQVRASQEEIKENVQKQRENLKQKMDEKIEEHKENDK